MCSCILTNEGRLEESLGAAETLVTNGDDLTVGQPVGLLQGGGRGSSGHLILKVQSHVAQLLLDVPDNLTLGYKSDKCVWGGVYRDQNKREKACHT